MARTGRPPSDNPKSKPIHVRFDKKEMDIINQYAEQRKITKTEAIRDGVHKLEADIKK